MTVSGSACGFLDEFSESIFFLGNGRMGLRGYVSSEPDARPVAKGVYIAGIFGEIKPGITDFVNFPTPVCEEVLIDGRKTTLSGPVKRFLNMENGLLTMHYSLASEGKILDIISERFLPKDIPSLIMQRLTLTPQSDMNISVRSGINAESCNSPIPDDQTKENTETIQLSVPVSHTVSDTAIEATFAIRGTDLTVSENVIFNSPSLKKVSSDDYSSTFTADAVKGGTIVLDKAACIITSRDVDPRIRALQTDDSYDRLLLSHTAAWKKTWDSIAVRSSALDDELMCGLNFSMFNLINSCSAKDPSVSIGARGLTHGRYKGCYFWDTDMFMLPFFLDNDTDAAKSLCDYRYRSLGAARDYSKKMSTFGARFPWMASLDGSEQCETWDIGCSELHITADVAYALDSYCTKWKDEGFYLDKAAELYVETARFWVSRYTYRKETDSADLIFVKGPDEYCGVTTNNLYTNVMVQHNLELAAKAAADLKEKRPDVYKKLGLTDDETAFFMTLHDAIKWPKDPATGRLRQDDTLHTLEPVDVATLKPDAGASYHHVCFDRLQRYKVIKQADALLLMTRFPEKFTDKQKAEAWEDFEPICLHDSTLSFASHALFALQNGFTEKGMDYLRKALLLDLRDVMGNTGHEGLHLACMGEAWQATQYLK